MEDRSIIGSSVIPFRVIFFMWLAFFLEYAYGWQLSNFGIQPRSFIGLIGIFIAPLIHGNLSHLVSNTVPLLFLGSTLFFFYPRIAGIIFFRAYFWTNILVWLFVFRDGNQGNHIGASGLVYGIAFFLIFFGFFRRDFLSLLISIITFLLYGGVFYGVLPTDLRVSWESHLAGALVGISSAVTFSSKRKID